MIEHFARWVETTPGVWAASVVEARYGRASADLHLIIHAEIPDPASPQPPGEAGTCK